MFGGLVGTNCHDYDIEFGLDNFVFLSYGHIRRMRNAEVLMVVDPKVLSFPKRGSIATFHDISLYDTLERSSGTIKIPGEIKRITKEDYCREVIPAEDLGTFAFLSSVWMYLSKEKSEVLSSGAISDLVRLFYSDPWTAFPPSYTWKLSETTQLPFDSYPAMPRTEPLFEVKVPDHLREDEILFYVTSKENSKKLFEKGVPEQKILVTEDDLNNHETAKTIAYLFFSVFADSLIRSPLTYEQAQARRNKILDNLLEIPSKIRIYNPHNPIAQQKASFLAELSKCHQSSSSFQLQIKSMLPSSEPSKS